LRSSFKPARESDHFGATELAPRTTVIRRAAFCAATSVPIARGPRASVRDDECATVRCTA
jgi:hypothetical protein